MKKFLLLIAVCVALSLSSWGVCVNANPNVWAIQPTLVGWLFCPPSGGTPIQKYVAMSLVTDDAFGNASSTGTVNTNGTAVTYGGSGRQFLPGVKAGWTMTINSVNYTIASNNGVNSITLTTSAGVQSGVTYVINSCGAVGAIDCEVQLKAKYGATGGNWSTWAAQMSARLLSLGFTAAGTFSGRYQSQSNASEVPTASQLSMSFYAMSEGGSGPQYNIHNAAQVITPGTMICGGSIVQGHELDPFDTTSGNTAQAAMNSEASYWVTSSGTWHANLAIIAVPEDGDDTFLTNQKLYHVDGGLLFLINNPMQTTSREGHTYTNKTYFVKQELANWLTTKYGTIGALNTAWGTSYTTFLTSDAGGTAGITAGTYASYGIGTGLLDEKGNHVISSAQQATCSGAGGNGPSTVDNWATVAQIKTDVEAFMAQDFAPARANVERTAYNSACGANCPPLFYPLYDGPTYVYTAMQSSFDGFWVAPPVNSAQGGNGAAPTLANDEADVAGIVAATTIPIIVGDYIQANADSYPGGSCGAATIGWRCQTTQAGRGSNMVAFWTNILPLKNSNGKYAVVGLEHWSMWDAFSQTGNFGLFTLNDNAYNGSEASTVSSAASYSTGHSYSLPTIITDGTHNQSLYLAGTSGASNPPMGGWNTSFYGATLDNTAKWLDMGNYTLVPESTNFGNALGPIRDFLTAGIADPPSSTYPNGTILSEVRVH